MDRAMFCFRLLPRLPGRCSSYRLVLRSCTYAKKTNLKPIFVSEVSSFVPACPLAVLPSSTSFISFMSVFGRVDCEFAANKVETGDNNRIDCDVIAFFPWQIEDCERIEWHDVHWTSARKKLWQTIVRRWIGVAIVSGKGSSFGKVLLVRTTPKRPLEIVREISLENPESEVIRSACWSLHFRSLAPLAVLGGSEGRLFVYNVENGQMETILRGHGGRIASVHAHPRNPQIICSTSRDTTIRLWNLSLPPTMEISASSPEIEGMSPVFGAPLTDEPEATNFGRCYAVFPGGQNSYGHRATVLDASFHPTLDLLAACSVDHFIKIWVIPRSPLPTDAKADLQIVDRPVFGTPLIHSAKVVSIHWLSPTVLMSQSSQSVGHTNTDIKSPVKSRPTLENTLHGLSMDPEKEIENFPGKLAVWEWLAYNDYKGALQNNQEIVTDSLNASDSHSFKILADIPLKQDAKLSVSGKLAVLTTSSSIRILCPSQFQPRKRPEKDVALTYEDMCWDSENDAEIMLQAQKQQLWKEAENMEFPGVVVTIPLDDVVKYTIFNAALYHGMLLHVGERERIRVWQLRVSRSGP